MAAQADNSTTTQAVRAMTHSTASDRRVYNSQLSSHRSYTVLDIEVDHQCAPNTLLSQASCSKTSSAISIDLYKYEDVPIFLRWNPYIKDGYRVRLPASHCLSSLFVWSNETVNIWSHLAGFFIFLGAAVMEVLLSPADGHFMDRLSITIGLLCFMGCMILSAGYHLFYCHSEKANRRWLAMDLAGISVGIIGCYIPGVHLAYYCHQVWGDFYMIIAFTLGAFSLGLQFHPDFLSDSWATYRICLYSSVAGYGVVPALHWIYLNGFHSDVVQMFAGKVVMIYLLISLALIFYVSKFPERMFPGRVDYVGSSHQWWHLLVLVAFLYWHHASEALLRYRITIPCQY